MAGARCPACQGVSVTAFPKGYLDRHPGLLPQDPPTRARLDLSHLTVLETLGSGTTHPERPEPATQADEPYRRPPIEAARRRMRAVYVVMIALAAFLVAVYEFYAIVLTKARPH